MQRSEPWQSIRFCGRKVITLCTILAILPVTAVWSMGFTSPDEKTSGRITTTGNLTLDDTAVISSQTIFSDAHIVTAHRSQSTIYLGASRLDIYPESELFLKFSSTSLSATLNRGTLTVFVPIGTSATIATNNASITTDPCGPALISIHAVSTNTNVTIETGRVDVISGATRTSVKDGESFSVAKNQLLLNPQATQKLSGNKLGWLIGGIGAGVGIILVAILGRSGEDPGSFGGCVIASGGSDPPPICP